MSDFLLLALILLLLLTLLLSLLGFALYSGLCAKVNVRTGSSPIRNIILAYKFKQGPYKDCGSLFTESCSIGPKLSCIAVYYDDPNQVPPAKCRYIVGSILSEGEEKPSEELVLLYQKYGFKIFSFPEVTHVVMTTFPFTTFLSIFLAVYRVYPTIYSYIKERKLCAHPWMEIYRGDLIYFIGPLAKQGDFYVPEVEEANRKPEEDDTEDRHTDITGADSSSDTASTYTQEAATESRETSVTPSLPPSLPGLVPEEDNGQDQRSRSTESSSSSSFEELNLEGSEEMEKSEVTQLEAGVGKDQEAASQKTSE
uniref:Testis expressed 264, ER-phagy receptor n=1 Tax=Latimeria chalumnae TaxID=7897 RepID=H3B9Q3_LATCH